jgi:hypothetical protein
MSEQELQDIITGDMEPKNEFERVCFDYVRAASEIQPRSRRDLERHEAAPRAPPQISRSSPAWSDSGKFYNSRARQSAHSRSEVRTPLGDTDMSISKVPRRARTQIGAAGKGGTRVGGLCPSADRLVRAMLDKVFGTGRFRTLVNDLFTDRARMEGSCASISAGRLGFSGRNTALLIEVAHLQGGTRRQRRAGRPGDARVSSAFVASETGKMARVGLLLKRANPQDRRGVLLSLAPGGRLKVDRITIGAAGDQRSVLRRARR